MRFAAFLLAAVACAQTSPPAEAMRSAAEKQRAAAARQRESIRKQGESMGLSLLPGSPLGVNARAEPYPENDPAPPPQANSSSPPSCDPLSDTVIAPMIDGAAKDQDIEARLLRAVIEQESAFRPCAVSPKGAKGLMQLMPDTAEELGVKDPFNPADNIAAGARYLKQLLTKYKGDIPQALGAYNAGPATVDQAGGIPNIRETRDYVKSIMQKISPTRTDPPSIPPPKPIEN